MKFIFKSALFSMTMLLFSTALVADENSKNDNKNAVAFIENITTKMVKELKKNHDLIQKNPAEVLKIVGEVIMPHIASRTVARKVMGRFWRKASKEQKDQFTKEFTRYLKRYYSRAFLSYHQQKLLYVPKARMRGKKYAVVSTAIVEAGKKDISIKYRLYHTKDGRWQVIDISIEGISLVINNQRQYASQIKREGLDAIIKKLAYNNQQEFK